MNKNENLWNDSAIKLAAELAEQGQEFIAAASLDEVTNKAGGWFAASSDNTKAAIVATMRATRTGAGGPVEYLISGTGSMPVIRHAHPN